MSPHGTISRYTNDGCRCKACREANRLLYAAKRRRRRDKGLCGCCGIRQSGARYRVWAVCGPTFGV